MRAIYSGDLSADQLAATFYNRGFEYTKKGDYEQAIADFDKAIDLRPKFIQAFNSRAAIHIELGLDALAFADVDEAIEITPADAGLYRHRAMLRFRRGAFAAALPDLRMAARLSPDDAQTALWLHFVESRSGLGDGQTLRRFAVNRNLSEWPGPAVAMFLGMTSAQAIADMGFDAASPDFSNPLMHRCGESRKMAIRQSLTAIPERPRCKQSVAQHCSNLNRLNGTRLWPGSMAESSHRMPEGCCWGGWIAASG